MKRVLITVIFTFLLFSPLHALQTISPEEGKTTVVNVSERDLNVVKTPFESVKALSAYTDMDVKIQGGNIFVKFTGETKKPADLMIMGDDGKIYPLVLNPLSVPGEVIVLDVKVESKEKKEEKNESVKILSGFHISEVKRLIKAMYLERKLEGYRIEDKKEDRTRWKEVSLTLRKRYMGDVYTGEILELTANEDTVLDEKEFYERGVAAVSIDTHELKRGEKTKVLIVRRKR
jgi:hypothetical protein